MVVDRNLKFVFIFSFVYCLLCYSLALHWYDNGYLKIEDILFDTDPRGNINSIAHGNGRNLLSHAFYEALSIPIKFIEFLFSKLGLISQHSKFRELLALSYSPLFSSLTLVVFYKILTYIKIKAIDAILITLIFALCFSNIMFAIIPETYPISCFLISLSILYYYRCKVGDSDGSMKIWLTLGILLTGITISNVCVFFIVYLVHLNKNEKMNFFLAVKKAIVYSIIALAVVFFTYKIIYYLSGSVPRDLGQISNFIASSFEQPIRNIPNLLSASVNSIGVFQVSIHKECVELTCNELSLIRYKEDYVLLLFTSLSMFVLFFLSWNISKETRWQDLYLIAIPIIVFNFILHTFFGREMFLYTQHWITPLLLLLVPIIQNKRFISIGLLLVLVVINVDFLLNVEQLVALK